MSNKNPGYICIDFLQLYFYQLKIHLLNKNTLETRYMTL